MFLHYLKLAFRLLTRSPFFTFINISGLSVGFAVFFILWQHSIYELQGDRFHKDYEWIYRAYVDFRFAEGEYWNRYVFSTIPPVLARLFKEKNKHVEDMTRLIHQKNFHAVRWAGPFAQVLFAVIIGTPLAYLLVRAYLQKFAEHVELQIWHFTLPISLLILVLVSSAAWVIWKAARRNPVEALKHE